MALCGVAFLPAAAARDALRISLPIGAASPSSRPRRWTRPLNPRRRQATCSLGRIASFAASTGAEEVAAAEAVDEEEVGPVVKFKMSHFAVSDHVSIGLQGRVRSGFFFHLKNVDFLVPHCANRLLGAWVCACVVGRGDLRGDRSRSQQAKRRGRRALEVCLADLVHNHRIDFVQLVALLVWIIHLEALILMVFVFFQVLKRLARRKLMYHSYAMQVYGYVSPSNIGDDVPFTLVHGVNFTLLLLQLTCLDALRHPFLCGPKWRTGPSMDLIRWGLGSTAVHMAEDYIYVGHQGWFNFLPGRWRLLYSTGRHIGLTLRQPTPSVLIRDVHLTVTKASDLDHRTFSLVSDISFKVIPTPEWPHDKSGPPGSLHVESCVKICPGRRLYPKEEDGEASRSLFQNFSAHNLSRRKWKGMGNIKELPSSLPAVKLLVDDVDVSMKLDSSSLSVDTAEEVLREVRTQIPFEMFDVSKFVCGTYVDSRMMVLRGISGSALLFTRSCPTNDAI
ncbi:hypothetical protein B296_00002643 [Ensete ventricosum]|uniref:Uncharacterized protein n=1 Tax=Ensete ventricosum TaxID=4639 RepID=A0A427AY26_ENSVE|nr:hypothetical protein B296_00002643 [Ensete ventricosum]